MKNYEYKLAEEILKETEGRRVEFLKSSELLTSLAITEFAKKQKGIKIISCHPKLVKIEDREIGEKFVPVLGSYLSYQLEGNDLIYYIEFNSNPFFPVYFMYRRIEEDRMHLNKKYVKSSGLVDFNDYQLPKEHPQIFANIKGYNTSEENIQQLVTNIQTCLDYLLKNYSYLRGKKDYVEYVDGLKQTVYTF